MFKRCLTCEVEKPLDKFSGNRNNCRSCNGKKNYIKSIEKHKNSDYVKNCKVCLESKKSPEFRPQRNTCKKCESKKSSDCRKDTQYDKYKDYMKDYMKDYSIKNRDRLNKYNISYVKNRKKNDIVFRCYKMISGCINSSLRNNGYRKNSRSEITLGLNKFEFKEYLESKFEDWMTWDNYGLYNGELNYGWDIDHIIPLSSAETEEEILKLCHFINLQPLCSYTNRYIKRDRVV